MPSPQLQPDQDRSVSAHIPTKPMVQLDSCPDLLDAPQSPHELGRLGDYRVIRLLGQGARGMVFLAKEDQLGRHVALKVMRPELAAEPKAHARFLREAQAMAQVKDEHIVTIHQVGEIRGVPYLAMEHLRGITLENWLDRDRPLTYAQIARIGREVAEGLTAAHKQGLIHRDIKPDNIWLEKPKGRVKLLDFGMARHVSPDVHLTDKGDIVGTPAYMSPEQTRDLPLDGRSDLYSLGVVLYRLCTGRLPFVEPNPLSLMMAIALEPVPPLETFKPDVPPALSQLIMQMLAKRPEDRPASAQMVATELGVIEKQEYYGTGTPSGRTPQLAPEQKTSIKLDLDDTATPPALTDELEKAHRKIRWLVRALMILGGVSVLLATLCVGLLIRRMG